MTRWKWWVIFAGTQNRKQLEIEAFIYGKRKLSLAGKRQRGWNKACYGVKKEAKNFSRIQLTTSLTHMIACQQGQPAMPPLVFHKAKLWGMLSWPARRLSYVSLSLSTALKKVFQPKEQALKPYASFLYLPSNNCSSILSISWSLSSNVTRLNRVWPYL